MLPLVALSFAADPTGLLRWRGAEGHLEVTPPAGWHVAPEAPAEVRIAARSGGWQVVWTAVGAPPADVPVPSGAFEVEASFSVCDDGGSSCRPVRLAGSAAGGHRGRLDLGPPPAVVVPVGRGSVVRLLDFAAVWCPPCNLLATEVLHDPADAALLEGLPVETLDVDLPTSWPLKDRYAVGGYPTLVAVDASGGEVARLVGYPGEAATLSWITGLSDVVPLARLEAGDPGLTGAAASQAARRLAEAEKPEAARTYFARAADDVDLHVARLMVDGERADAEWLLAHAPPGDWLLGALDAAPDRWPDVVPLIADLEPSVAADVVDVIGASAGGDAGKALSASALVLVKTALTGDPAHDKAYVGTLADLYARIGRLDRALPLLDEYTGVFPTEFTYDQAAARLLLDAGRLPEAEARARAALGKAWGDQKLRAVQVLARALARQGHKGEALAALDAAVAAADKPDATVHVRTHRYLAQVAALRAELAAEG